ILCASSRGKTTSCSVAEGFGCRKSGPRGARGGRGTRSAEGHGPPKRRSPRLARRSPIRRSAVAIGRSLLERPVRRLLRNASWLFLSDAFALLAGMVGTIIAARWLGAADYGRVTLVVDSVGAVKQLL